MAIFTDGLDRKWDIRIDVPTIKKMREYDMDVTRMFDDGMKHLVRLAEDPVLLVDTLWLVCESQAKGKGIDEESFGRGLFGDSLSEALRALQEGTVDFFQNPKRRETLREVLRKIEDGANAATDLGATEASKALKALSVDDLASQIVSELGERSGSSPDTSV